MTKHSGEQRLSDAQAQDEHEADELSKMKRMSAGGRPKKAGSEMLLDATTLLRSRKASLEQKFQSTKNLIEEIWKEVHRTFPQEIPPDLQLLYTAVEKEHTEAAAQMDTHIAVLLAVDPQKLVEAATCAQDLRQSLAGISKNEIQAATKALDSAVQSLRKGLINATNGDKEKKNKAATDAEPEQDKGPLQRALSLRVASKTGTVGLCDEIKAKKNVYFNAGGEAFSRSLMKAGIKGQFNWLKTQLKLLESDSLIPSFFSPLVEGKLTKLLRDSKFADLLSSSKFPAEYEALQRTMFAVKAVAASAKHFGVGLVAYGIGECTLLLEGQVCLAGVPLDLLEGRTLHEKLDALNSTGGADRFMEQLDSGRDGCFFVVLERLGDLVFAPPSYMVVTASSDSEVQALRWGVFDGEDKPLVPKLIDTVKMLMVAFPELAGTEFKQWNSLLELYAA